MNKISLIFSVIGIISAIGLILYVAPNMNERVEIAQEKLDSASLNLLDVCMKTVSVSDLYGCKKEIGDIVERCGSQSTMSVCTDPRIEQFFMMVDERIVQSLGKINDAALNLLEQCYDVSPELSGNCDFSSIEAYCQDPRFSSMSVCNDSRFKIITNQNGIAENYPSDESSNISEQTELSEECMKLKEIMEQNRFAANNNDPIAIGEFGTAMNDYNRLGCP